jgi:hypothetical protein
MAPTPDRSEGHHQSLAGLVPPKNPAESAALVTTVVLATMATVGVGTHVITPMAIVAFRTTVTTVTTVAVTAPVTVPVATAK